MSIKRNYIYNTLLQISSILFPLITFPYVSHVIGPEGTGKISFIMSVVQYFVLIAAIGIPMYGAREIARIRDNKEKRDQLFSELLSINMLNCLLMSAFYLLMLFFVPKIQTDLIYFSYAIFFVLLGFTNVDWFFSGIENFKLITIRSLVVRVLSIACLFLFVHNKDDFNVYYALSFLGLFANNFINIYSLRGNVQFVFSPAYKKHIKALLLLFSTVFAMSIYTLLDITLLGFLTDDIYVGYYNASIRLNKMALPIIVSLGAVMLPRMSKLLQDNNILEFDRLMERSFSFVCLLAIPISVSLYLFADKLVLVLAGVQYIPAIKAMQILSPLAILIGFNNILAIQILNTMRYDKQMFVGIIWGTIVSFSLNLYLIPKLFHEGAAWATLASEVTVTATLWYFVSKLTHVRFALATPLKAGLAVIPLIILNMVASSYLDKPIYILCVAGLLGLFIYFAIQYFVFKNQFVEMAITKIWSYGKRV